MIYIGILVNITTYIYTHPNKLNHNFSPRKKKVIVLLKYISSDVIYIKNFFCI